MTPPMHALRLHGFPGGTIRAECDCGWSSLFEPGHTIADFASLQAQHDHPDEAGRDDHTRN